MSAALQLTTDVDTRQHAGPDPREWIAVDEAADLLGIHTNHLSRECREKLERVGRAKKARPAGGGAAKWFVARRHDLRLAPGAVGEAYQAPELSGYTRRQVDDAYARVACVQKFRDARSHWPGKQDSWLPRLVKQLADEHPQIKISPRSLRRWYKDYQRPEDVVKLISNAGGNRRQTADPSCSQVFKDLYLSESRLSIVSCWRQVDLYARTHDLAWLTEAACRNQLDERIPPEEQAKYRDPKAYRNGFQPYIEQDPEKYEAGERWDGDHCVLDLLCWHGDEKTGKLIRPWLTAWMDWRTRKIVGWHLSDGPNSHTILSAFRSGMLDESNHGGPRIVWIDNGKDYDSYTLHGETKAERRKRRAEDKFLNRELNRLGKIEGGLRVDEDRVRFGTFKLLDIEPHFSIPYNPTGKARLERWFGTMHDQFDKFFPTYCGPTVVDKPEDLAKRCKEQPQIVPHFDTVLKELQAFIDEYNDDTAMRSGAVGLSPNEAMQRLPHTIRTFHDKSVLNDCMGMWSKPVSVGRNGVRICPGNVAYTFGRHEPAIRALIRTGKKVHVRYDPEDMRQVEVYDANGSHLCTAPSNAPVGNAPVKHDDMKRVMNERKRRSKQRAKLNRTAIQDIMPLTDAYAMDQAKKKRGKKPPLQIDPALVKTEPRDVKLEPKPKKFDLAEHLRSTGGLHDITKLMKKKEQAEAVELEGNALDSLDLRDPQPDEDDAIDIFGELSWPMPIPDEDEVEFDFFNERQAEGGAA
ncbi:MAG: transposase [Planctomycetota bacterium]